MFFNDQNMISINGNELGNTVLRYKDADVILVDLNDLDASTLDGDVLYLIEPSTIKLNKMMVVSRNLLSSLTDKKVVLNMSLLSNSDVKDFERESGCRVFYSLPAINDKADNSLVLNPFFEQLGLIKRVEDNNTNDNKKFNNLFGLFKS